jgi:23S rRNA (adenine2503-C2)-methyltransferase
MIALQSLTAERLCAAVPGVHLAEARKVLSAVHRRGDPLDALQVGGSLEGVRSVSLAAIRARVHQPVLRLVAEQASSVDPFAKYVFALDNDGRLNVETVRIPLERERRYTVCVSSQAGCAQGCTFCATGRLGLLRNLESWQIVEQVRTVHLRLLATGSGRVHGVVFQGMGEPTANLENVVEAISVLSEPSCSQVSASNITVSTVGSNPAAIRRLARDCPKARLALSIGSARPEVRERIMPAERLHALGGAVLDAAVEHALATGLQPLWAVTPLAGVNDTVHDAAALAELFHVFTARTSGIRPRLSVVPYNSIDAADDPYRRTALPAEAAFRDALRARGVFSHKRYSGGGDVGAACGQLAGAAAARGDGSVAVGAATVNWAGSWAAGLREDAHRPALSTSAPL